MALIDEIMRDEGFKSHPYLDTKGKLTIGYGFNIAPDGPGLAQDESQTVLEMRIGKVAAQVSSHLPWTAQLDDARHSVLVNMAYNMGIAGLLEFQHFLAAVQAGDYEAAAGHMLDSLWAKQTGARATRLAEQMRTGIEQ